jgi:hypothetical protein
LTPGDQFWSGQVWEIWKWENGNFPWKSKEKYFSLEIQRKIPPNITFSVVKIARKIGS